MDFIILKIDYNLKNILQLNYSAQKKIRISQNLWDKACNIGN